MNWLKSKKVKITLLNCDCKIDWLWVRSPLEETKNIYFYVYFHIFALVSKLCAALNSATQALHLELGGKWKTECLATRFPLSTLLCAGYSVKLTNKNKNYKYMRIFLKYLQHFNTKTIITIFLLNKYLNY